MLKSNQIEHIFLYLIIEIKTIKMNTKNSTSFVNDFMNYVKAKDPGQPEFHQAVHEVVESLADFLLDNPRYLHAKILERMVEPERIIQFRVPWLDDRGIIHINRVITSYSIHYTKLYDQYLLVPMNLLKFV